MRGSGVTIRRRVVATIGVALMVWASAPAVAAGSFVTADGVRIPMPDIRSLNCRQIGDILALIDASGYRGAAPRPIDRADAPLFEYETRLARAQFRQCSAPTAGVDAFSRGYSD
jgi:hypothetical protein